MICLKKRQLNSRNLGSPNSAVRIPQVGPCCEKYAVMPTHRFRPYHSPFTHTQGQCLWAAKTWFLPPKKLLMAIPKVTSPPPPLHVSPTHPHPHTPTGPDPISHTAPYLVSGLKCCVMHVKGFCCVLKRGFGFLRTCDFDMNFESRIVRRTNECAPRFENASIHATYKIRTTQAFDTN